MGLAVFVAMSILAQAVVPVQEAPVPKTDKPAPEKKICRNLEVTGSMFLNRVCRTKAEWDGVNANNQAAVDRQRGASNGNLPERRQ